MEKSAHFRSPDPIQNLRLKVTLSRLSGPRKLKSATSAELPDQTPARERKGEKAKSDANKENQEDKEGNEGPVDEETGRKMKRSGSRRHRKGKESDAEKQEQEEKPVDQATAKLVPPTTHEDELTAEFAWQQKVFSRREVAMYAQADDNAPMLERKYRDQLLADGVAKGHTLFTYVHSDDFNAQHEIHRTVSTSTGERMQHLVRRLLGKTANPTMSRLMQFQAMSIMAEIEGETEADEAEEKLLVAIKAYPNGSFDIRPSFTVDGETHRFQTSSGAVYEYTIHNVQEPSKAMLVKQKKAIDTATDRAARLRSALLGGSSFVPPPGPSPFAVRVTVLLEIVAARGFDYDSLYVEYAVKTNSSAWSVTSGQSQLTGVTQVTTSTYYEPDATATAQQDSPFGLNTRVAHFGFPVELELEAQLSPEPSEWPTVYFQLASYDQWDRYRTQGYCYLDLDPSYMGSRTHYLRAWKPTGTVTDRMHTFFTGGAPELEHLSVVKKPAGFAGAALNKYGFSTDTTGELKVRVNMLAQQQIVEAKKPAHKPRRAHAALTETLGGTDASKPPARKGYREMSAVMERAKLRLAEARGETPDSPPIKEEATLR